MTSSPDSPLSQTEGDPVRVARTDTVELHLRPDGILVVRVSATPQTVDDARKNLALARDLVGGETVPMLVDIRTAGPLDRPSRDVYAQEADFISAQALLVGSAFSRIAANLFLRLSSARHEVAAFDDPDDALRWLQDRRA